METTAYRFFQLFSFYPLDLKWDLHIIGGHQEGCVSLIYDIGGCSKDPPTGQKNGKWKIENVK